MTIIQYAELNEKHVALPDNGLYAQWTFFEGKLLLLDEQFVLRRVLNLADFGYHSAWEQQYDVRLEAQLLLVSDKREGAFVYRFDGERVLHIPGMCVAAAFGEGTDVVWAAFCTRESSVECRTYDMQGALMASLPIETKALPELSLLQVVPGCGHAQLAFAGEGDECKSIFLEKQDAVIRPVGALGGPNELATLCFSPDGNELLAADSSGRMYRYSYPALRQVGEFHYPGPEGFCPGTAFYCGGGRAVIGDDVAYRYYLLDLNAMQIVDEIAVAGHLPKKDRMGNVSTDIVDMSPVGEKLLLYTHKGLMKKPTLLLAQWPF